MPAEHQTIIYVHTRLSYQLESSSENLDITGWF